MRNLQMIIGGFTPSISVRYLESDIVVGVNCHIMWAISITKIDCHSLT